MDIEREPVVTAAAIAGLVAAALTMLVSLGVIDLSPEQQAAILAFVAAAVPIAAALWARQQVTPLVDPKDDEGERLVREYDGYTPVKR